MSRLFWSEAAQDSRDAALEFIAKTSLRAALAQLNEIERQTSRLLKHPNLGRPGHRSGTRELSINRTAFVVTYRIIGENVQILHFRHTSQRF